MKKYRKTHNVLYSFWLAWMLWSTQGLADTPTDYYADAIGKTGRHLKSALHNIVNDHVKHSYKKKVWEILQEIDEDPNNSDNVILIYSRRSQPKLPHGGQDNWNREHTWPSSFGFHHKETWPPYTDVHHLRASDATLNSTRGNLDFDNGGQKTHSEAPLVRYDNDSWEVPDEVKGDIARGLFYMAVRYEGGKSNEPDLEITDDVNESLSGTNIPKIGKLSTLLEWHIQDIPSEQEKIRNDKIFKWQNNRNPFIDHPEWVAEIWGGKSWPHNTATFQPSQVEIATLISSQIVYQKGETIRVTLPPLPSKQTEYVAIGLPDNQSIFTLSGLNALLPYDGISLPAWQGSDIVIKISVTADIPKGEYTLYLLRMPIDVEPLTVDMAQWLLGVRTLLIR
jgi:endonuclease I